MLIYAFYTLNANLLYLKYYYIRSFRSIFHMNLHIRKKKKTI